MKRMTLTIAGLTLLVAGGCSTTQSAHTSKPEVAMTQFSPLTETNYDGSGIFHLGAGDELGREIFVNYLASLHTPTDEYYATGSNPDPQED